MARTFLKSASDYLTVSASAVRAAPLTMACFLRVDTLQFHAAMSVDNGGSHAFFLGVNNVGQATAQINAPGAGGFAQATSASSIGAGAWHHIAGVYRGPALRQAYVDGGGQGTDTTSVVPAEMSRTELARIAGFATYLDGALAEAAIWKQGLTEAELRRLARGVSPALVRPRSLVFYAPLVTGADFDLAGGLRLAVGGGAPGVTRHPRVWDSPELALRRPGRVVTDRVQDGESARRRLLAPLMGGTTTLRTVVLDDAVWRWPA